MTGEVSGRTGQFIPALPTARIMPRIPSPRGGRPEACRLAGWVRRLRPGLQPGPGRLREPTKAAACGGVFHSWDRRLRKLVCVGYYDPCARSSLAGPAADREPPERRRDDPMRGTGEGDERDRGKVRMKRGPEFSNRRRRSATGRADGGSIHPRRSRPRKRITKRASRRSAAPQMRQRPRDAPAGGEKLGRGRLDANLLPSGEKVAARSADG
jgi:hypothetical protein